MTPKERLIEALVACYGTVIEQHMDQVLDRVSVTCAALLYAGNQGDTPLCIVNRVFESIGK